MTVSISLQVPSGRQGDFEDFLEGISEAADAFPGFTGVRAFRPRRGRGRYRVVLWFANRESLDRWVESDERSIWVARAEELSDSMPRVSNITGTAQEQPLSLALTPLEEFVRASISGIGLLLLGTVLALAMANSRFSDSYSDFWNTVVTVGSADYGITESLRHWVNDGLMALFFFIVGLEIKREVLVGDLRYLRQATLPAAAALGGAIVPALCYLLFTFSGNSAHGWGVPIGTDTAFSLGILSLLGARVSPQLVVFLTAFAIIDDILAVGVIAVFYTDSIKWSALGVAALLLACLVLANRAGFHRWPIYAFLGIGVWLAVFESGVHGTMAGVLVAMTVPARSWINPSEFIRRGRNVMDEFERLNNQPGDMLSNEAQQHATQRIQRLTEEVQTPMTYLEHGLTPWVSLLVLPLFAFANAGIPLTSGLGDAFASSVTWGVITGLVIGKPLGITLFAWIAIKTGLALPAAGVSWPQIIGVAGLGGIGFTMSLFISELAFSTNATADHARIGVLVGSIVAGVLGYLYLRTVLPEAGPESDS